MDSKIEVYISWGQLLNTVENLELMEETYHLTTGHDWRLLKVSFCYPVA